jgi:hypothetical protein
LQGTFRVYFPEAFNLSEAISVLFHQENFMLRMCALVLAALVGFSSLSAVAFAEEAKGGGKGKGKQRPHLSPEERIKKWDKDNDGKLSLDEFKANKKDPSKAEARFKKLDANNDGFVTVDEMKAGEEKAKKKA